MSASAWLRILESVLPSAEETDLLRACLLSGDAGARAWTAWRAWTGNLEEALKRDERLRRLLPLLSGGLRRHGVTVDSADLPYLRAATAREQLRCERYERILGEALSILSDAEVPIVVLKGAALSQLVYEDRAERHSHDIDLLVRQSDLERAADRLVASGFQRSPSDSRANRDDATLVHSSGLPVELHHRLFQLTGYDLDGAWSRSRPEVISGVKTLVLTPVDQLIHVCGHALYSPSRSSLLWVCDGWHLIQKHPELDWNAVLDRAKESHLVLPLSVMLSYLAEKLQAPIDSRVLDQLRVAATHANLMERDAAAYGVWAGGPKSVSGLFHRTTGWSERVAVARSMLWPSPSFARTLVDPRHRIPLLFYYVFRPLRFVIRRASRRWTSLFGVKARET